MNMIRLIYLISFLTSGMFAFSQNLVPNYSFEEFVDCPYEVTSESKKELIPFWEMPTRGTSDYFNACAIFQVNVPDNILGNMFAQDGNAYAGIVLIERPPSLVRVKKPLNYREYLQTELLRPLVKDKLYCIKFYFSIASYSTYAVNKIGLHISDLKIGSILNSKVLEVKPQIELDTTNIIIERDYWHQVCDTFRANGEEKYITIGNFYNDCETNVENLDCSIYRSSIQQTIKEHKIAYYYIDVVSVVEIPDTTQNCCIDSYLIQ